MSTLCENASDVETVLVCASEPASSYKSPSCSSMVKVGACEPSNSASDTQSASVSSLSVSNHQDAAGRHAPMFNGRRPSHTVEMHSNCVTSPRDEPHVLAKGTVHVTPTKDKPTSPSHTIYPNTQDNSFKMVSPFQNSRHQNHTDNIPVVVGPKVVPTESHAEKTHVEENTDTPATATASEPRLASGGSGNSVASMMSNLLHGRRPSHKPSLALVENAPHVEAIQATQA